MHAKPNVIDLFAGVGGLSLGFKLAGFNVVLANEYDSTIAEAYVMNHPNVNMITSDITKLSIVECFSPFEGQVSVIIGGPPCQGFSQKGQRKSISDKRNYLFHYFLQVVSVVKPEYFLMENVPNLLTSEKGLFIQEIRYLFGNIGYTISAEVLNASDYGVPQNRRRAFILGKKGSVELPLPKPSNSHVTTWDAISDLAFLASGEGLEEQPYLSAPQNGYQESLRGSQEILFNHVSTKHAPVAIKRLEMIPPGKGKECLPKEHHTKSIYSGTWSRMKQEEASVTITTRFDTPSSGKFTHPYLHRAITVREAARIQSFPDRFRFYGTKGSQMKQVGNAVPPLLARAVADVIYSDMH